MAAPTSGPMRRRTAKPARTPLENLAAAARGLLAGEGDRLWPISQHLFTESRKIDREVEGLMVHSRTGFAHIGEADAELQQAWKFMRLISARRYPDLVDRAPKAIAGMRVVMTQVGGSLAGSGADENQAEMILKLVRKFFQLVRTIFVKVENAGDL